MFSKYFVCTCYPSAYTTTAHIFAQTGFPLNLFYEQGTTALFLYSFAYTSIMRTVIAFAFNMFHKIYCYFFNLGIHYACLFAYFVRNTSFKAISSKYMNA